MEAYRAGRAALTCARAELTCMKRAVPPQIIPSSTGGGERAVHFARERMLGRLSASGVFS